MALYFCIHDVLDQLGKINQQERRMHALIPVSYAPPACGGFKEDAFSLNSFPKILDLNDQENTKHQLALLLAEAPLYKNNLILLLDDALTERHFNNHLMEAVTATYRKKAIPQTLDHKNNKTDYTGNLRHPELEKYDNIRLSEIYIKLVRKLGKINHLYDFEPNVIGKDITPLLSQYDGFANISGGKIKADILIGFGTRQDYKPALNRTNCLEEGYTKAMKMEISEPHELIWAWMEAEHYQMRRCYDIDQLLNLKGLPRIPNWVRTDAISMLEKEGMKQIFAEKYLKIDPECTILNGATEITETLKQNGARKIDEFLERLLDETSNVGGQYNNAAGLFHQRAQYRIREARLHEIT
jgi:hypothetical protein